MTGGLILAAGLVLVGALTAARQRQALRALAAEPFLPDEDRRFRRNQARRRALMFGTVAVLGGLVAIYYLSGMDARMDDIGERRKAGGDEPGARTPEDERFARLVALYWTGVMGLMFAAVCVAFRDVWATRVYWSARYKELKADHQVKLQRDLAVYRQQKLNARAPGLKPPGDDTATDEPPV